MDKLTNDEYMIAGTLADLIEKVEDGHIRHKLAEARDELVCQNSKLGQYRCEVKLPFGKDGQYCDLCLEAEIHELWKAGVHTISSCCGHGRVPPYIQVLNGESVQKMHELGYIQIKNEACPDNPYPAYRAKTYLPCFTPCRKCAKSEPIGDGTGWYCLEENFDTELDTFWCFVPEPPKEEASATAYDLLYEEGGAGTT